MLGDKIKNWLSDQQEKRSTVQMLELEIEVSELIESHKENVKLKERVEKLEEYQKLILTELNCEDGETNITEVLDIIQQFKQCESHEYAEIGKAITELMGKEVAENFLKEWKSRNEVKDDYK